MSETVPETTEPASHPTGRIGWRRRILILLGGTAGLVVGAHMAGIPLAWAAAGTGAATGAGYGAYHYPHVRNHFWGPWSKKRESKGKGFSKAWMANWKKGPKLSSPFRRGGGGRRGAGFMSGRRGFRSPGSRGLRRGSSGQGRAFRAGSRRGSGGFRGFRRGSGTFRQPRGASGRPAGTGRRRARTLTGRRRGPAGTGPRGGPRTRRGSWRPWRRRTRAGTGGGTGPKGRGRTGGKGKGRTGARTARGSWRPWRRRGTSGPKGKRTGGGTPKPWWRRRGSKGKSRAKGKGGKAKAPRRFRRTRRVARRAWKRTRKVSRPVWRRAVRPAMRWTGLFWAGRRVRAGSRWAGRRVRAGSRWAWRRVRRSRMARFIAGLSPRASRKWRAARARRMAHRARKRALRAKLKRVAPRHKIRFWKRMPPAWRRRLPLWSRVRRAWRARRAKLPRLLRRRPRPWAPRGKPGRGIERFDLWRERRWRRRALRKALADKRARPPMTRPAAPARGPVTVTIPAAPAVPLPGRMSRPAASPASRTGGTRMADVHAAADEIEGMIREWMDANDLDETLEGLHQLPRAFQRALSHLAEELRENAQLADFIPEAVDEAASAMTGIAEELESKISFGVQRN